MTDETRTFIDVTNSLINLKATEIYNATIVESCNRNLANRINTFIKIIEEQDKEIEQLIRALKRGDCYCEVGIGNPMYSDHTDICKEIRARGEA